MDESLEPAASLEPRTILVWRAQVLLRAAFAVGVLFLTQLAVPERLPYGMLMVTVAAAGVVAALVWPPAYHRSWRYRVGADDLRLERGVWWRSSSVIPFARIQHVDTEQGPLERWLGLARLVVYTAGVRGAQNVVPGLAAEDAERLRDQLAAVGGRVDAV